MENKNVVRKFICLGCQRHGYFQHAPDWDLNDTVKCGECGKPFRMGDAEIIKDPSNV